MLAREYPEIFQQVGVLSGRPSSSVPRTPLQTVRHPSPSRQSGPSEPMVSLLAGGVQQPLRSVSVAPPSPQRLAMENQLVTENQQLRNLLAQVQVMGNTVQMAPLPLPPPTTEMSNATELAVPEEVIDQEMNTWDLTPTRPENDDWEFTPTHPFR